MTKSALPVLLLAFFFLVSCHKSSNSSATSGGTLTATVDGSPMTFNNILVAKDTTFMGAYVITLAGATSLTSSSTELSLTVDGTSPISTGTYTIGPSGNTTNLPSIAYTQGTSLIYGTDVSGANSTTVIITSLSKTNIQGTFSGTLTLTLGTGATTKNITDGKFNVNFK